MSYLTTWHSVDQDVFDALVHGRAKDHVVEAMVDAFFDMPDDLHSDMIPEDLSEGEIEAAIRDFLKHRRDGTRPQDYDAGVRMTLIVYEALVWVGTTCGDVTEGSPSALNNHALVYDTVPALAPMRRLVDGGFGFTGDWPFFAGFSLNEVYQMRAALEDLDEGQFLVLDEEAEALIEALNEAMKHGNPVITTTA